MTVDFHSFSRSSGVPVWPRMEETDFRPVADDGFSQTITDRFLMVCEQWSERVAIFAESEMTYAELLTRSRQLAAGLSLQVADQHPPIAILAPAGIPMVTAIFGTLFAGGSYLPLDVRDSKEQWARTIDEMGCCRVLAPRSLLSQAEALVECCPELMDLNANWDACYDHRMLVLWFEFIDGPRAAGSPSRLNEWKEGMSGVV